MLGVGVGWARQEFDALGVPFHERGRLTDDHRRAIRLAWQDEADYRSGTVPIWVGGNSDAALRRAVRLGDAWYPLRFTLPWFRDAQARLATAAAQGTRPVPSLLPRIALQLTDRTVTDPGRLAGVGPSDQVLADLEELRRLGAEEVVFDPFGDDPEENCAPRDRVARAGDGDRPDTNGAVMQDRDEPLLRRAIELAAAARAAGNPPYGSLLAGPDGKVLVEDQNTSVTGDDITAHPELKLARWAAQELDPDTAAATTMYTSCQPCGMCTGAIERSGLGRVVFALSTDQLLELQGPAAPTRTTPRLEGPALFDEARVPIDGYYR